MPYSNLEKRKEYHRLYMREHRQTMTPEQKERRKITAKIWQAANKDKLSEYQRQRWLRDKDKISKRKKERDEKFPEIRIAQSKAYYEANKEAICQGAKEYRLNNLQKARERANKYRRSLRGRFTTYIKSAKDREIDFLLTEEQFNSLMVENCDYCGKEKAMGVDRIDSDKGYFIGNVVACCKTCNYMKRDMDYKDFITHIKSIINHLSP